MQHSAHEMAFLRRGASIRAGLGCRAICTPIICALLSGIVDHGLMVYRPAGRRTRCYGMVQALGPARLYGKPLALLWHHVPDCCGANRTWEKSWWSRVCTRSDTALRC